MSGSRVHGDFAESLDTNVELKIVSEESFPQSQCVCDKYYTSSYFSAEVQVALNDEHIIFQDV